MNIINETEALDRLSGDHTLLKELLEIFISKYTPYINQLTHDLEKKNYETLRKNIHAMKGSCLNLSLTDLSNSCITTESSIEDGTISKNEIQRLTSTLSDTIVHLQSYIRS